MVDSTSSVLDALNAARAAVTVPKSSDEQPHWDNPLNDPNKRLSIADDPDGTRNAIT